jgi:hypothetical protein
VESRRHVQWRKNGGQQVLASAATGKDQSESREGEGEE